ncbi:hypothetical protein ABIA39_008526 [Nocardia sp. GAS34]|uniref:hypothetical protein n=1 Tax=unclassified Nocardia TaxID=2637762 RepID=UPI003D1B06B8
MRVPELAVINSDAEEVHHSDGIEVLQRGGRGLLKVGNINIDNFNSIQDMGR